MRYAKTSVLIIERNIYCMLLVHGEYGNQNKQEELEHIKDMEIQYIIFTNIQKDKRDYNISKIAEFLLRSKSIAFKARFKTSIVL